MQSLQRIHSVLKCVAASSAGRLRLTEIARAAGLSKPTTTRLIDALLARGLLEEDRASRTFSLGPELVFLGLAASRTFSIIRLARPALENLAAVTEDSAYLTVRSGDYSICGDRVLGTYPIKTMTIEVGDRRPLGIGAGSLALLAAVSQEEVELILERNVEAVAGYQGFNVERLRIEAQEARSRGYAYTRSHRVHGVHAIGVAVRDSLGSPVAAVSTAAIASRFDGERAGHIGLATAAAARALQNALQGRSAAPERPPRASRSAVPTASSLR